MRVVRNFEKIYRTEEDPWKIGQADSSRYLGYFNLIKERRKSGRRVIDIGSGMGAFLSHFRDDYQELYAVEISQTAVNKGRERFPDIQFFCMGAESIGEEPRLQFEYDLIIFSDVIYYLKESERETVLNWINSHIADDGLIFINAWAPGGRYLKPHELKHLIEKFMFVENQESLPTGHIVFSCRKKNRRLSLTVDYETWHPIPPGKVIDWEKDIFEPATRLSAILCEEEVRATFFIEMGEYFWLKEFNPSVATAFRKNVQALAIAGHDIQLHLHPCWLPELGARFENGEWTWNWKLSSAHSFPGDLIELIRRCKLELEQMVAEVKEGHSITAFRAGAYQAQPYFRLHQALVKNGINIDSSVFRGGVSKERGYDYSNTYTEHQPYFCSKFDPQLLAPPAEQSMVQIPVGTTHFGSRLGMDGKLGGRFVKQLIRYEKEKNRTTTSQVRLEGYLKSTVRFLYRAFKPFRPLLNPLLTKYLQRLIFNYPKPAPLQDEFFVVIGHTKGNLQFQEIQSSIKLAKKSGFIFNTLAELGKLAHLQLSAAQSKSEAEEAKFQEGREKSSILSSSRHNAQSYRLQGKIPFEVSNILDLGCGAGYWTSRIAQLRPWAKVVGLDGGEEFIAHAKKTYSQNNVSFKLGIFSNLPFEDDSFDCVYADNTLEHAYDIEKTFTEIFRVLAPGGVLVAALPPDGLRPDFNCDNHNWKTIKSEVLERLQFTGFKVIDFEEINTSIRFLQAPFPPSANRMIYVVARKGILPELEQVKMSMNWIRAHLDPKMNNTSYDPLEIMRSGFAWCAGNSIVLQFLLSEKAIRSKLVHVWIKNHPRGRGAENIDTHTMVEAHLDGKSILLDPTTGKVFDRSLSEILKERGSYDFGSAETESGLASQIAAHYYNSKVAFANIFKVAHESMLRKLLRTYLRR